jgi:hypothetical protein
MRNSIFHDEPPPRINLFYFTRIKVDHVHEHVHDNGHDNVDAHVLIGVKADSFLMLHIPYHSSFIIFVSIDTMRSKSSVPFSWSLAENSFNVAFNF